MGTPEITFIVPCYNYARYLGECLDSIFAQRGIWSLEILVIDDASVDNSWEVISRYGGRVKAIRHESNMGHAATLAEGLRAANGSFVARIDPDDRLRPDFLDATVPILREFADVGLVYGDVSLINELGVETVPRCDNVHGGADYRGNEFIRLLGRNFICAPSVLARREAWLEALPIPDGLAFNDWHFTTMIARRHHLYYLDRVIAEYRVHPANLHTAIAASGKEEQSVLRVLDRYFSEAEANPALEEEKREKRRSIFAAHYQDFARKYFGTGQFSQARRCYLTAARYQPRTLLSAETLRHLIGTVLGQRLYGLGKAALRAIRGRDGQVGMEKKRT